MTIENHYSIGLDIGTGSVGWAVIGDDYRLKKAKGKNLIGVRLFDSANTAEERRVYRTTRRRLSRRRWRLRLLNDIFAPELMKVDENFLARFKYSWVNPKDENNRKDFQGTENNFNGAAVFGTPKADQKFYSDYPTIYHLRKKLMEDDKQHDIREVYLAIHHIVKYRGHFLTEGDVNPEATFDVENFVNTLENYDEELFDGGLFGDINQPKLFEILTNKNVSKSERVSQSLQPNVVHQNNKNAEKQLKAILTAIVGNLVNLMTIFALDTADIDKDAQKKYKFNFGDTDIDDEISEVKDLLDDSQFEFLIELKNSYDGLTLKMLLGDYKTISDAMIARYESHKVDWALIKESIRNPKNRSDIDLHYINLQKDNDDLRKKAREYFAKLIEESDLNDDKKAELLKKIEDDEFLPIQRTKSNGAIPHQLHRNELDLIIEKQSKYYPFLSTTYEQDGKNVTKLAGLVNFRVPYYVGPLVSKEETDKQFQSKEKNHWMTRKESGEITPWNLENTVDTDQSAADFINRLTGTDTYLIGEKTLPKNSLIYQEYNVLQELNNARINKRPLDIKVKQDVFEHVFKTNSSVTVKIVEDYLKESGQIGSKEKLEGLSDPKKFNNNLSSYNYLVGVLGREYVDDIKNKETLENIIELQTVFEDKKILNRQLNKLDLPNDEQKEKLSEKHFTGWGRLSKKLLTTKILSLSKNKSHFDGELNSSKKCSILEALYHSDVNLSVIVNNVNDEYDFRAWLDFQNMNDKVSTYQLIDELAGDRAIKRGITQSFRVMDDIVKALGHEPDKVYVEFAREDRQSVRTKSRKNMVIKQLENAGLKELLIRARETDDKKFSEDRLYLWFLQEGIDVYTGEKINIEKLSFYDIDHIIPQSYVKDNSLDNRVLVSPDANRAKNNSATYLQERFSDLKPIWKKLNEMHLMSDKKINALSQVGEFSDRQRERFIARSLVETRQIIKNVSSLVENHFNDTKAIAIRSDLTSDMRRYIDVPKNRDVNNYHHAHDALLIATVGKFIERRGFFEKGKLSDTVGHEYNLYTKQRLEEARKLTNSERVNPFSFVVGSMASATVKGSKEKVTNKKTGDKVWSVDDFNYLLKVTSYKKILVTTRVKDDFGELYDQIIIGAKGDGKKRAQTNISKSKATELYGGYNKIQNIYSALIFSADNYRVISIPRFIERDWQKQSQIAIDWLNKENPNSTIVIKRIPYDQPILLSNSSDPNDTRFAYVGIASGKELHNLHEIVLDVKINKIISRIYKIPLNEEQVKKNSNMPTESEMLEVFDKLIYQLNYYPYSVHQLMKEKIESGRDNFIEMPFDAKKKTIVNFLNFLHANKTQMTALKSVGGKIDDVQYGLADVSTAGQLIWGGKMQPHDIFIFQSPSGIFETRKTVEQLYKESQNKNEN